MVTGRISNASATVPTGHAEILKTTLGLIAAKQTAARLDGMLTALRSRPRWQRLAG